MKLGHCVCADVKLDQRNNNARNHIFLCMTCLPMMRSNVEVNRRAEGKSKSNRRLGGVGKGAAALERCGVAEDYGWSLAGKQAKSACATPKWQSSRPETGEHCRSARA